MLKILVVDDTKSVHAFLRSLVSRAQDVHLIHVMNGAEAVEALKSEGKVDVILLDWEMPVLNGPETLRALKNLGVSVPTIMMTTKNAPEDIQKMLEAGAAEYIMKPFTADILFEKIGFVLGKEIKYAV